MAELSLCCNSLTPRALPPPVQHPRSSPRIPTGGLEQRRGTRAAFATKPGGFSLNSSQYCLCVRKSTPSLCMREAEETKNMEQPVTVLSFMRKNLKNLSIGSFIDWIINYVNTKDRPTKQRISKSCQTCRGKGAIECPGCKGTGKNKKNGNIFERWKCFDCQGFGLKSCPSCGQGGLTPEQRGER